MHPIRIQALSAVTNQGCGAFVPPTQRVSEFFGSHIFSLQEMQKRLTRSDFEDVKQVVAGKKNLEPRLADVVASAVRDWALEKGVTHYTHWFQPMTGLTAEKHDSLISLDGPQRVIEKFGASQLIQSEPDASSFPSGGMRSTFEARGYTAWDSSSPMFIMEHTGTKTLCIPSVFVSYTGHALDTKTGLLRSMDRLSDVAVELLKEMGDSNVTSVGATLGCEQEYFLIDKAWVHARPDLLLTGRTLLGADMPKGQQLEDHYFGAIPTRVQAYMADVETELYRLGVPVKTRHNEVAPSQFETAPIFEDANLASDHNMLTMEVLRRVALKHGFVCLLHEKPFAGINGSGKHCNWSMSTDSGINLLEPGKSPYSNIRFIAVLSCVLDAVYRNQVALRAAIASHGNDHRLGANEAPPAIISVFMGSTLTDIMEHLAQGKDLSKKQAEQAFIEFGLGKLPSLPKDNTDRNRTSPFAFTGNKFEFRAVGSSQSVSLPVAIINAAVAQSMKDFVTALRTKKPSAASTEAAVLEVAKDFYLRSKSICFEGNGYSDEWKKEASRRGLFQLMNTPDALGAFLKMEHHKTLVDLGVFSEDEVRARISIRLEQYNKHLDIEARSLMGLVQQNVLPAAHNHQMNLAKLAEALNEVDLRPGKGFQEALRSLTETCSNAYDQLDRLDQALESAHHGGDELATAKKIGTEVVAAMNELRETAEKLERVVSDELWVLPKYREMLFLR